jgi:hypothetical protein
MTKVTGQLSSREERVLLHELNHRTNNEFTAAIGFYGQFCSVETRLALHVISLAAERAGNGRSSMTVNRLELVGLSVLVLTLTTTVSLAQNTTNPMKSGNTTNPILSGNTVTQGREVPVSPSTPNLNLSTGTNPFTGLPCTGPPTTGSPTANLSFPSVFGPPASPC